MAEDKRFDPARLQQIERRLKARYAALCDNQYDADGIANLFIEDAVWESPALGRFEGREAIRTFFQGASGIFSFAIHYSLNGHIEVEGDTARARWYLFMPCTVVAGNQAVCRAGIDHETYARMDGTWMFRHKRSEAADERPVRDWLGQDAFRVTGVSADRSSNGAASPGMALPSRTSIGCKTGECDMSANGIHNPPEFKHAADAEWGMGRFGNVTKFLFHPRPERPTEPNAGFLKYAPGASFPLHRHDFAQIWYIIEGEFAFAGKLYGPGTIAYMADPHFEHDMHTATGGTIFFVQYPGPTTGVPPIYDGRMNLKDAPPLAQRDLEH